MTGDFQSVLVRKIVTKMPASDWIQKRGVKSPFMAVTSYGLGRFWIDILKVNRTKKAQSKERQPCVKDSQWTEQLQHHHRRLRAILHSCHCVELIEFTEGRYHFLI